MSLFDHIAGGLEINTSFTIDFSISNGEQCNPSSLHYLGEDINVYVKILRNFDVCDVTLLAGTSESSQRLQII